MIASVLFSINISFQFLSVDLIFNKSKQIPIAKGYYLMIIFMLKFKLYLHLSL